MLTKTRYRKASYSRYMMAACFGVMTAFLSLTEFSQTRHLFPLKMSVGGRYLLDQNDKPFLIRELSARGLIQSLSEKDESASPDSVRKKGFNAVLTCVVSKHMQMTGDPPDWQGISPFRIKWGRIKNTI